jgi:hypothetical protein
MPYFKSKPTVIKAKQWHKPGDHQAVVQRPPDHGNPSLPPAYYVVGHQGAATVRPSDWIITEPDFNGFYPCDPETFALKYEPVDDLEIGGESTPNKAA